jgi:predicted TIM-barrel fold metal-dependent hydrolase
MKRSTEYFLSAIAEIRQDHLVYDIHAHPFNVATGDTEYSADPGGVFSMGGRPYTPPDPAEVDAGEARPDSDEADLRPLEEVDRELVRKMQVLRSRKLYAHTGPAVMGDQMKLAGVDRMLLLPVPGPAERGHRQMEAMSEIFGGRTEYLFGCCVTNEIPDDRVADDIGKSRELYSAAAIKIHPNITGMDLAQEAGASRLQSILEASRLQALPVVVHGGLSLEFVAGDAAAYASLENIARVDWSVTDKPVIIAHAGMFGHDASAAAEDLMPVLASLMDRYSNLYVDLSGLSSRVMKLVLGRIDTGRILFGTDTLYFPQWLMVLRTYLAVTELYDDGTERFVTMASRTPERIFAG